MSIPVVFIHFGESAHVALAVEQAKHYGNEVVLLTENKSEDAKRFADAYVHMSTNPRAFELMCFERWFVLRAWMLEHAVNACLYLDSDVLLYANAEDEWAYWRRFDFTLALGTSAHVSFWHYDALDRFCEYLLYIYEGRAGDFAELERIYREMQAQSLAGGICDMTLLRMFDLHRLFMVGEMCEILDGAAWDHNLNVSDSFELDGGRKRIEFVNGLPYGTRTRVMARTGDASLNLSEKVRFNALHFQGSAKRFMREFIR